MTGTVQEGRWLVELAELRREISELRTLQVETAKAVDELVRTFRQLSTHLGIASEPYRARGKADQRDLPGFA